MRFVSTRSASQPPKRYTFEESVLSGFILVLFNVLSNVFFSMSFSMS
jgi:hypothetical protein